MQGLCRFWPRGNEELSRDSYGIVGKEAALLHGVVENVVGGEDQARGFRLTEKE